MQSQVLPHFMISKFKLLQTLTEEDFPLIPPSAEISMRFRGVSGIQMCNHKQLHMEGGWQGLDWDREQQKHQGRSDVLCRRLPAVMI